MHMHMRTCLLNTLLWTTVRWLDISLRHPLEASFAIKLALGTCCPLCTPWPLGGQAGQAGGGGIQGPSGPEHFTGTRTNSGGKMVAPTTEVVVVLNKPTAGTKLVRWPGPAALQSRCSRLLLCLSCAGLHH